MASDFDFESSDILGGALPVGRGRVAQNVGFSAFFKICALGASTLVLLLAFRHGRTFFLRWRERHYKLSMRRRYGIPDNDQRPFNVAYAAARLAQDDKRKFQDRIRNVLTFDQPNPVGNGTRGPGMMLLIPIVSTAVTDRIGEEHGVSTQQVSTPVTLQVTGHDKTARQITIRSPFAAGTATQALRIPLAPTHADVSPRPQPANGHANARDEESGDQHEAKSNEYGTVRFKPLTIDDLPHFSGHVAHVDMDSAPAPRRSKRMADSSDESDLRHSQENRHDKRRRKVSGRHLRKRIQKADDVEMNGVSEDKMSGGGKKRDRTEMDSSFVDDDILSNDQDTDFALHRHRRRRQRKSTNSFRGQKRGRDLDSLGVDTDSGDLRGRRKAFRHPPDTSDTDPSIEDAQISRDPLCRGRRVGEEWEAHGVRFRVGTDGKRRRRVLVKEDRPKFSMPVDSEHPDRSASVTAIVERWYTEEQYMAAKEAHELAWQDSDKSFAEPETPAGTSSNSGKQLLWASTSTSNTGSPVRKIRISGHSSIASPRMALFPVPAPPQYTRRVSSLYSSSSVKPTEMSPKLRPSNSYSKWEKQEIEAEAIARLRRKAEEKEKAKAEAEAEAMAKAKEEEAKRVATVPALPAPAPLAKADEKLSVPPPIRTSSFSLPPLPKAGSQVTEPSNPSPLFKLPTPPSNVQSSEAKDKHEAKTAPAVPLFSFPSAPIPATQTPTATARGLVPSNPPVSNFFSQNVQTTTVPSSAPDAKSSTTPSIFPFGQTKVPPNNSVSSVPSAPQGSGSNPTPQGFFSFSQPPNPPSNSSNPSASVPTAGSSGDSSKPKFNFGVTSKPTSANQFNPPAAATVSDSVPKPIFGFGIPKSSSVPTAQPVTNLFGNAPGPSTTATQVNPPSLFKTSENKPAGTPASGVTSTPSIFKVGDASSANQGQLTAANKESTGLFGVTSGGKQAQNEIFKPPAFGPASTTAKPLFSFGAGPDASSGTKPAEPGKSASVFTFNTNPASSAPAAVPPTPGSVFSDAAAKSSQNAEPISQPSFGAPKNAAAPIMSLARSHPKVGHDMSTPFTILTPTSMNLNPEMRPRLPARNNLSVSYVKPSPPPPYGDTFASPEVNNLSESATVHRIHALANDVFSGAVPSAIEEWINGRSREELSSLLVRANELIQLTMTSELSKTLYNSNITLEEKHKALLARIPAVSSMTPRTTPSSSPAPTPEYRPSPLPHLRASHARRISVSPSDLALLADQNAELLQKLEKLEAESVQANLAGRRRLGKLEKEIDVLREELDQHRTQSDALQLQVERGDDEARRRRQEWNDRVRAHRSNKSGSSWAFSSDGGEGSLRDFAPGSSGRPALPSAGLRPALPTAPDSVPTSTDISSDSPAEATSVLPPTPPESSLTMSAAPSPAGESALVAQLVSKVRELEITNEQILESQRDTANKLHEAQIEAEGIRRLYAFLDEQKDVELEVVEDREQEDQPTHDPNSTMRFRSLRRSINGDLRQLSTTTLEKGAEVDMDMEGTVNSNSLIKGPPLKARKTVVGLFDTPSQPARDGVEPAMMTSNPFSPALSSLDLPAGSPFSVPRQDSHGPTLGSELGSDYGEDYAENHHLRSSSLYDVFLSGPPTTSRPVTPPSPPRESQTLPDPLLDEPEPSKPSQDLDKTPQKSSSKATTRRQRLSDTVRARTNHWVDRRFNHTTPIGRLNTIFGPEIGSTSLEDPIPISKPTVVQVGVQTLPCDEKEQDLAAVKAGDARALERPSLEVSRTKRSRTMKVLIELWLWVQFIIIIMVFLWAVTKRGPRSVLRNASRTLKRVE
ncbi:hypothetical protein BC827DRAFT_1153339 [Russula dissimulans]|nr:hypothetical protein BC827DRAFT_1153339 [Russula dissimulans]